MGFEGIGAAIQGGLGRNLEGVAFDAMRIADDLAQDLETPENAKEGNPPSAAAMNFAARKHEQFGLQIFFNRDIYHIQLIGKSLTKRRFHYFRFFLEKSIPSPYIYSNGKYWKYVICMLPHGQTLSKSQDIS